MPGVNYSGDDRRPDLDNLVAAAKVALEALSPAQQEKMLREQRDSWVRGEMAIGSDADEARDRRVARATRDERQQIVAAWVVDRFGPATLAVNERLSRLIEETIELAQAEDYSADAIRRLVDYVYTRPPGVVHQELGGVAVCLLAYAEATEQSVDKAEFDELTRILRVPAEKFRQKHATKIAAGVAAATDFNPGEAA